MEPRKVQKVGYSTLSVSLPMDWVKKRNVNKGDILFLSEESDGTLRVTPEPTTTEDQRVYIVNVDNCDNPKILERVIVGNYVLGRNVIRVESKRRLMREQIESIRNVTQRLLGIGIIEESDRHLLLQCSVDPKQFPITTVINRLYVIVSIMFKEAMDAIIDRDLELARDAITREYEADTIFWLMERLLASAQQSRTVADAIGIIDQMDIVEQNIIAWYLEMIGDRLNEISKDVIKMEQYREKNNEPLIERLGQIGQLCFTMFDKAINSFFDKDIKIASDAVDLFDAVENEEETLLMKFQEHSNTELAAIVNEIAWELRIIAEHSSAIAEVSIDHVIKGKNKICEVMEKEDTE
jgi:phosphate uptake regulator